MYTRCQQNMWAHKWQLELFNDGKTTVKFQHFDKIEQTLRNGKVVKHLKAVCIDAMKFIISFIEKTMLKIIHHHNQLKHFRMSMGKFQNIFNTVMIDRLFSIFNTVMIDRLFREFIYTSEVWASKSHWAHDQITIHFEVDGEKSYHPYLPKDRKHDQ